MKKHVFSQPLSVQSALRRSRYTGNNSLPWSVRLPEIRERIASETPDLIGLQETGSDTDIGNIVPMSKYTLISYHFGSFQYGDAALLFKTDRFELLDSGQLRLGPDPDLPMALGFRYLAMIRYVNWAVLREKSSGFTFFSSTPTLTTQA